MSASTDRLNARTRTIEIDGERIRIGAKMYRVLATLEKNGPAQSRLPVANRVGPRGSTGYGYAIVGRCIRAGLARIDAEHPEANPHGSGALVLTDAGRAALKALREGDA